jgi:hypothetical protein
MDDLRWRKSSRSDEQGGYVGLPVCSTLSPYATPSILRPVI